MSTATAPLVALKRPVPAGRRPVWTPLRWLTLAGCLAALVYLVGFGARESDYDRLQAGLSDGSVSSVRVESWTGGPPSVGPEYGPLDLRLVWRDGFVQRFAEVVQSSPGRANAENARVPVVIEPIATAVHALNPTADITWGRRAGSSTTVGGWQVTGEGSLLALLPLLAMLVVVAYGPEPALATPWAWFWLVFSPIALYTAPVYLVWAARGHKCGWRLNGWWAFALAWWVLPKLHLW